MPSELSIFYKTVKKSTSQGMESGFVAGAIVGLFTGSTFTANYLYKNAPLLLLLPQVDLSIMLLPCLISAFTGGFAGGLVGAGVGVGKYSYQHCQRTLQSLFESPYTMFTTHPLRRSISDPSFQPRKKRRIQRYLQR